MSTLIEPGKRSALEAVAECDEACEACAQGCIKSHDPSMADCASFCLDCAVVCRSAETLLSRNSQFDAQMCQLVARISMACRDECAKCDSETCGCSPCQSAAMRSAEECAKIAA